MQFPRRFPFIAHLVLIFLSSLRLVSVAQESTERVFPYQNPLLSTDERVKDLVSRMSAEEKFRQLFMVAGDLGQDSTVFLPGLFGFQINTVQQQEGASAQMMHYTPGTNAEATLEKINGMQRFFVEDTRWGIPMIAFDEALHGLVRTGATAFPQSIALAATFDTSLMADVAGAIARETRARGLRMVLSPVVNVATDVRWGRVEETYGEDPELVSQFGLTYIQQMERHGIIATPKHFVANHGDGGRDSYPVFHNERLMAETYFKPFKVAIQQGGAQSIMTAYNSFNGRPCTANNYLLNKVLKEAWGFQGFVISDAAATGGANVLHYTAKDYSDAGKQSIENGLDVIFQTDFSSFPLFSAPFLNELVRASAVDSAVTRVLSAKFNLGLFDNPYESKRLLSELDFKAHRKIAYEAAVKSMVLLKNEDNLLPLATSTESMAIIGFDAQEARLGGYSGPGNDVINGIDGLKQAFADAGVEHAPGCGRISELFTPISSDFLLHNEGPNTEHGLTGAYYANVTFSGKPAFERTDRTVDFQWTLFGPNDQLVPYDHFSVEWSGFIVPNFEGTVNIGIEGNDGYQLIIDGKLIIDRTIPQTVQRTVVPYTFTKDRKHSILIRYAEKSGNARFRLIWDAEIELDAEERIQEAVMLAQKSDVAVVFVGIEEGEFRDRVDLKLPGRQEELIQKVAQVTDNVVVIIVGGSAVDMSSWLHQVDAVMMAWYPGEAGGEAVAALLSGKATPSGKLPISFPMSVGQVPLVYNHLPTGRGDDYLDATGHPLFPFGYGLSYTQFDYTDLAVDKQTFRAGEAVEVRMKVKNTGPYTGVEVVQLYLRDEIAQIARPVKQLTHFQRVTLQPGEEKTLTFLIKPEHFEYLDESLTPVLEPGKFRLMIGSSSKDIRLRTVIEMLP